MSRRSTVAGFVAGVGCIAWVWDSGSAPWGDSLTWHTCTGEFTSAQIAEVTDAANSWDAGAGEVLRGAVWDFVRGSDLSGCADSNFENEVYMETDAWFSARGIGSTTPAYCFCQTAWHDIVFRSSATWSNSLPSQTSSMSLGQVALHEFGHSLGLDHENTVIATMNGTYPAGGDLGNVAYRPHEDDYVGLAANRPGSSTGKNLLLSKFKATSASNSVELWTSAADFTSVCRDLVSGSSTQIAPIYAVIEGTSIVETEVEWWLSADTNCGAGTAYSIGTEGVTIGSNTPLSVRPSQFDFRSVPAGTYTICAKIDPDDNIAESSSASDNDVQSEKTLIVEDC